MILFSKTDNLAVACIASQLLSLMCLLLLLLLQLALLSVLLRLLLALLLLLLLLLSVFTSGFRACASGTSNFGTAILEKTAHKNGSNRCMRKTFLFIFHLPRPK
jgi:hypothetical protein